MAPLKKQTSMLLSGMASTSLYFMSMATGPKHYVGFGYDIQDFLVNV
jgi:hypothetical protein